MRICGIDPGLTRCGIAIVDAGKSRLDVTLRDVGVVRSDPADDTPARLVAVADGVRAWLDRLAPDQVAIERVFMQRNVSNALTTAQVLGAVTVEAGRRDIPVVTYTPTQVKAAVTGHGGALKQQVSTMVARVLKLADAPKPADAADAAAVALCHAWQHDPVVAASTQQSGNSSPAVRRPSGSGGLTAAQQRWRREQATRRVVSWEERLAGRGSNPDRRG